MRRWWTAYAVALVCFVVVDGVWLGVVASSFYRDRMGHLMAERPNLPAAAVFYVLFLGGLVHFVIAPVLEGRPGVALVRDAALFGLVTYATFDLTALATLKGFPVSVALVDLVWGTVLATAVAAASVVGTRAIPTRNTEE